MNNNDTAPATRTLSCPTCRQHLTGNWFSVSCYCTKWDAKSAEDTRTHAGIGRLLGGSEIVRLTDNGTLIAVDIYA